MAKGAQRLHAAGLPVGKSLFYAAFELRCALVLRHPGKYKPGDVLGLARAADREAESEIHFASLVMHSLRLVSRQEALDIRFLAEAHRKCDQYLHAQKDPDQTVDDPEWVERLRKFLYRGIPEDLSRSGEAVWQLDSGRQTEPPWVPQSAQANN